MAGSKGSADFILIFSLSQILLLGYHMLAQNYNLTVFLSVIFINNQKKAKENVSILHLS